jgi:hypothetical protein
MSELLLGVTRQFFRVCVSKGLNVQSGYRNDPKHRVSALLAKSTLEILGKEKQCSLLETFVNYGSAFQTIWLK